MRLSEKGWVNSCIIILNTVIIRLSPGGLFKTRASRGGLIREGALIQKEAFLRGDLFETHYVLKEANANFWRVRRT